MWSDCNYTWWMTRVSRVGAMILCNRKRLAEMREVMQKRDSAARRVGPEVEMANVLWCLYKYKAAF